MLSSSAKEMFKHYAVGDELIDSEHMKMFELIELGRITTSTQELIMVCRELLNVWEKHKNNEITLMEKVGFPYVKEHENQHKFLTTKFKERFERLVIRKEPTISKYMNPMRDILNDLLDHIDHYDIGVAEYIKKNVAPHNK